MDILKTINDGDTMLDFMNLVIKNIKFYINHREELKDIKISNEDLFMYIAKIEEVKDRYYTQKVPNWFKEYNPTLLLSGSFPYMNTYLGFTFSLYDMINMVLCEDMKYKITDNDILTIDTTKLLDSQHVMVYFKEKQSLIFDKDEWLENFKKFL